MADILYQHYNVDNIFNRSVIGGLLYLLNHSITYEQVWDDNVVERVTVPFAYNFAHAKDQRFAQDNYTFFGRECFSDKLIDGKFDMLPRFAVTYSGSSIDSGNITNRFVKGKYQKEEDGKVETYVAYLYSIPLTMTFDIEGWIDNYETAFKIEQELRNKFYKNQTFNVLYKGIKIGCCAGFPESITEGDKTVSYSFEQEGNIVKMSFSIAVECYQPCFDESMAIKADNKVETWAFDVNTYNGKNAPDTRYINVKLDPIDISTPKRVGDVLHLSWKFDSNTAQGYSMGIYYIDPEGKKHVTDIALMTNEFDWTIPNIESNIKQPEVFFINNELVSVVSEPKLIITTDNSGTVNGENIQIVNAGEFSNDGYIQISLEYIDRKRNVKIHDCYVGKITNKCLERIDYYKDIDSVTLNKYGIEPTNNSKLKYSVKSISRKISVGILYPSDKKISDQIDNILII